MICRIYSSYIMLWNVWLTFQQDFQGEVQDTNAEMGVDNYVPKETPGFDVISMICMKFVKDLWRGRQRWLLNVEFFVNIGYNKTAITEIGHMQALILDWTNECILDVNMT